MAQARVDTAKLALGLIALAGLIGCANLGSAPKLVFQCAHDLQFEAQLYEDMALIEGKRGHVVLPRVADETGALRYADTAMQAEFGLGLQKKLALLRYANIPGDVFCKQAAEQTIPVQVHASPGPRPPPPRPDPHAPVQTNIRLGDGPWDN